MKPERVLAVVVGIIVVIAAVAAVVASRRDAVVYDADTPEGAVQAYLRAVIDDDHDAADAYLDPAADCDWADVGRVGRDVARAVLVDSEIENGEAVVRVEIVHATGGGPFDVVEFTEDETFRLVRHDDRWLITGSPWPFYLCGSGR